MNKHLIIVRYIPPTNFRPSRVSMTSGRSKHDKVIIPYEHETATISNIAVAWLTDHGYTVHCQCDMGVGVGILVNEFEPLKVRKSQ